MEQRHHHRHCPLFVLGGRWGVAVWHFVCGWFFNRGASVGAATAASRPSPPLAGGNLRSLLSPPSPNYPVELINHSPIGTIGSLSRQLATIDITTLLTLYIK
jgi:hypothetical protein